jgi:3-dehydroquinate synthase
MHAAAPSRIWGKICDQRFSVAFEYPVIFTRGSFDPANPLLSETIGGAEPEKRHRLAVFVDEGVLAADPELDGRIAAYCDAHAAHLELVGDLVRVPGGEAVKNDPDALARLLGELIARRIDRHSYAVAIGGGAVLDAVGYAAAIFHRGVRHVRFPTTVLAQDDSGVGVKNAVNLGGVKNLVGTFAPPRAVINDGEFIDLLPEREKRAGMSEAVKVALIRDAGFYAWLEANADALAAFEPAALDVLIERSARLHMHQIAQGGDPFETGSARPLDFGHWSAHRLESLTDHGIGHGEAVAIGIALDTRYSVLAGLLPEGADERVALLLERLGFRLWHEALARREGSRLAVIEGLAQFQEHLGGELTVTLLEDFGRGIEVHAIDHGLVEEAVGWLGARGNR